MKKRSKKRIPQDIKPWSRIRAKDEKLSLPLRQTIWWTAGARRNWETKILSAANIYEHTKLFLNFYSRIRLLDASNLWKQGIYFKLHNANKFKALSHHKNYCLLTGRARTFNRTLFIARHGVRKLAGLGVISGLTH